MGNCVWNKKKRIAQRIRGPDKMAGNLLQREQRVGTSPHTRYTRLATLLKIALLALGLAGALLFLYDCVYYAFPYQFTDFGVYYASAKVAADGGNPFLREAVAGELARLGVLSGPREYLYPSVFLVLIQPLLALPLDVAHQVFLAFSYVLVGGSVLLLWKSLQTEGEALALPLWLVALGSVSFSPFWSTLTANQNNLWVLLPLIASFFLTLHRKDLGAGAALGLSAMLKVTPAFLFLYFLAHRRWRALASGLAVMASLEFLSWLYFGKLLDVYLPGSLLDQSSRRLVEWNNLSLAGMMARAYGEPALPTSSPHPTLVLALSYLFSAAIAVAALYVIWKRRKNDSSIDRLTFGWLVTTFLLVSPIVHGHHLVYLLIPLFTVASVLRPAVLGNPDAVAPHRSFRIEPARSASGLTCVSAPAEMGTAPDESGSVTTDIGSPTGTWITSRRDLGGRRLPVLCLTLLAASFILIELDYWRIWDALSLENWGWWAHSGTWGLLMLWGLQLAILLYPRKLAGISLNASKLQQARSIVGKQTG